MSANAVGNIKHASNKRRISAFQTGPRSAWAARGPSVAIVETSVLLHKFAMHPLIALFDAGLSTMDFGVMSHGLAEHGRDYEFIIEDCLRSSPGTYRLTFTHVVDLEYTSALQPMIWTKSWSDDFIEYERWEAAGHPDGYVFGTNWSNAYPGFAVPEDNDKAASWSNKLNRKMHSASIETDRFKLTLVFHDVSLAKLNDETPTISQVTIPLG